MLNRKAKKSSLEKLRHPVLYRPKTAWADAGPGDAFKSHPPWSDIIRAQRKFYQATHEAMSAAARASRDSAPDSLDFFTKPQIAPAFALAPSSFAAWACVGLSAYREFALSNDDLSLRQYIHKYLLNPVEYDRDSNADASAYSELAGMVADCVQKRAYLKVMTQSPGLESVETYRLFLASAQDRVIRNMRQIVEAAVFFADLLPGEELTGENTVIKSCLRIAHPISTPYLKRMHGATRQEIVNEAIACVKALAKALSPFLPKAAHADLNAVKQSPKLRAAAGSSPQAKASGGASAEPCGTNTGIIPLKSDVKTPMETFEGYKDSASADSPSLLHEITAMLERASEQKSIIDDPRGDILQRQLVDKAFMESPIQGAQVTGHSVRIRLGANRAERGDLFSRTLRPREAPEDLAELLPQAQSLADKLRKVLYPSIEMVPQALRFRGAGQIDPQRLPLASFSEAVFKRYEIAPMPDLRGRPTLLIACDASGSFDEKRMTMLKILAGAWLLSTTRTDIRLLAAIYHSGPIRRRVNAPLVQWLYHPQKTPAVTKVDAMKNLLSLPKKGVGKQSDALSIAFLLEEAKNFSKGENIYFTLISDCKWNKAVDGDHTGADEVAAVLKDLRKKEKDKMRATLVGLGVSGKTGLEGLFDDEFLPSEQELENPLEVSEKIAGRLAMQLRRRYRDLWREVESGQRR